MIVYAEDKRTFIQDVRANIIDEKILERFSQVLHSRVSLKEIDSWRNSLNFMSNVLDIPGIPEDSGIALEYNIPQTSKRIDVLVSGKNQQNQSSVVIVELKQWQEVEVTDQDGVIRTALGGGIRETPHPSYQAWSYAALLEDFNEAVTDQQILLHPCAYLHNCTDGSALRHPHYQEWLDKSPVFLRSEITKLQDFLTTFIHKGDQKAVLYSLEQGKIKPSKALVDHLTGLLQGNKAFIMIDDQKTVYEEALELAKKTKQTEKSVLIVNGGPGTGKSVVAINLLVELTAREKLVQYVTKNAAPRSVFAAKLAGKLTKTRIQNLFRGSGSYTEVLMNQLEYIGGIIGPDLLVRDGKVLTYPENRSKQDRTIRGWVSLAKSNPDQIQQDLDVIIKNTYRTLMTRGMKGCMVYSQDPETREYFRGMVG